MKTEAIIQDYYGATYFIEENKDEQLIIFIVDDNKVYLNLLERAIKRPNFSVYTFASGEECLDFIRLKPDLVLLDYHLDGVNPYAKKGDVIYNLIKEMSPSSEITMISSDSKFNLIAGLHLSQAKNLVYKDKSIFSKINTKIDSALITKENQKFSWKFKWVKRVVIIIFALFCFFLYKYHNG